MNMPHAEAGTPASVKNWIAPPSGWPVLREAALHGIAGEVVRRATENSEADPTAVLATFLTHAGAVMGLGPHLRVADRIHHGRLFNVLVGRSARGRKGTSEGAVREIWNCAQPSVGYLAWKPGPLSSGEGIVYAVRDALGDDPGVSDKRLLIVDGEYGSALRAMKREGNTLSTTMRSAWDGGTLEPIVKNHPIIATNPHIGIVGHITEEELKSQLGQVEFFNGFANRHLWWCVRRSRHIPLASGLPRAEAERLGEAYASRLLVARGIEEMTFDPEARRCYDDAYSDLMLEHDGLYGLVMSRSEIIVIRVALIYACLDGERQISVRHLQAAFAVLDYCDASALRLFGDRAVDARETKILDALERGSKTRTALHQLFAGHCKAAEMTTLLAGLVGKGKITEERSVTGGRDSYIYTIAREANEAKAGPT